MQARVLKEMNRLVTSPEGSLRRMGTHDPLELHLRRRAALGGCQHVHLTPGSVLGREQLSGMGRAEVREMPRVVCFFPPPPPISVGWETNRTPPGARRHARLVAERKRLPPLLHSVLSFGGARAGPFATEARRQQILALQLTG